MTRSPADFGHFTKLEENMNSFTYSYPVKVYFGEKAAAKNLAAELANIGPNVMLAYGGGSIKKNGVYDELLGILKDAGKTVTEFAGIMSNPTYAKVQEGAVLAKKRISTSSWLWEAAPLSTAARSSPLRQSWTKISGNWSIPITSSPQSSSPWVLWSRPSERARR